MRILALEREVPGTEDSDYGPHLKAEARRVWDLVQEDNIREVYFRQDRSEAVLMLECHNIREADEILGTLPLVQAGLIVFELIPLKPYPGFERLFR